MTLPKSMGSWWETEDGERTLAVTCAEVCYAKRNLHSPSNKRWDYLPWMGVMFKVGYSQRYFYFLILRRMLSSTVLSKHKVYRGGASHR